MADNKFPSLNSEQADNLVEVAKENSAQNANLFTVSAYEEIGNTLVGISDE